MRAQPRQSRRVRVPRLISRTNGLWCVCELVLLVVWGLTWCSNRKMGNIMDRERERNNTETSWSTITRTYNLMWGDIYIYKYFTKNKAKIRLYIYIYTCAFNTYMYLRDRSFISRSSRKEVGAESAVTSEMVQHRNVLKAHNGLWFRHEYKSAKGITHGTVWSRVTPQGPRITVIGNLYSHNTIFRVYQ